MTIPIDTCRPSGNPRVVIENVHPRINDGAFPARRVVGQQVHVQADIYADSHDRITAWLLYRPRTNPQWDRVLLQEAPNDLWTGQFPVDQPGEWLFTIEAWVDHFVTWQQDIQKKYAAGQDVKLALTMGADLIAQAAQRAGQDHPAEAEKLQTWQRALAAPEPIEHRLEQCQARVLTDLMRAYPPPGQVVLLGETLRVRVQRKQALFSTWYELFPRSAGPGHTHGTLADVEARLPGIKKMGFDIVYLPPIHPIGQTHRKGKNNEPTAGPDDPGSCWAIGSEAGGHKAIHPALGTFADFDRLVAAAAGLDMDIALDIAFQCSPDHPYVTEHPEWFVWRPDGTVQYAENPPKKYEDIIPLNFECVQWQALWQELKSILEFWIARGIRVFRVDNPHTKAFCFWQWLVAEIESTYPDVILLSEAFTRPKKMYRLAKVGFTQSYTYFTWRNTKYELMDYLTELTRSEVADFFRPNFWPNTPDILPTYLQYGQKPAFIIRLILAATLSSNYGIYGPAYELCVNEPLGMREEYQDSEKYEIKDWDSPTRGHIRQVITRINTLRRENPALQETNNLTLLTVQNDQLLGYMKQTPDGSNVIICVVNLDPQNTQAGMVELPLERLHIADDQPFLVHDLFGYGHYLWQGRWNYVELNPYLLPAHILRIQRRMQRESDFETFV